MDKNKLLLTVGGIFLLIVAGVSVWWFLTKEEAATDSTKISGFSNDIASLPAETRLNMEKSLYRIIKSNNEEVDPGQIQDATMRKDSSNQDKPTPSQYSGDFLVDIPSLRQSYKLLYLYSKNDDGFDSGYPFTAQCVADEDLLYEKFDCKDQQYSNAPADTNLQKLPYKAANYTIQPKGEKGIVVQIMLTHTTRTDKFFKSYAQEANNWLVSQGFDLSEYTLEYRDVQNKPLTIKLSE